MIARIRRLAAGLLGQSSPLVLARLMSAALTFALPLVLVRLLDPHAFGTYKQFFLVAMTLLLVGQLGLTQSLYYFLPRGGPERGAYVGHVVTSLSLLGALLGGALYLAAPVVARWVGSGELAEVRLPLALFAAAMLAAAPLEAALTSEGRIGGAAVAYVVTDGVRATALVLGARLGGPLGLYWAAVAVALLRVLALFALVGRVLPLGRPRWPLLKAQLAYALPFAGASLLFVGQRTFSQYAVSASFDPATFALFTVAAFHLPVIEIIFTPVSEVMIVQIGRDGPQAARRHWDDAVRKLALILLPATFGAWLLGPTVLPLLFTREYAGAVPLFILFTLEFPLAILPLDALLRASGDTRFLFVLNLVRLGVTAAAVTGGIALGGLRGAILGGLASEALARVVMLWRGRRFLDERARLWALVDRRGLGRIAAAAALACLPAWAVRLLVPRGPQMVVAAVLVYGLTYLALPRAPSLIRAAFRTAPAAR